MLLREYERLERQMKKCFKCGVEKDLGEFYKHKQMSDGHLNKCKGCAKNDSTKHRNDNIEKIREYDRGRGNRQSIEYLHEYRNKFPLKYKAHSMVNSAIKSMKLFKEACGECGSDKNTHAHHDDYSKPLNVRWLCAACHSQWHRDNGEALNP